MCIEIYRMAISEEKCGIIEMHGFSDASEVASGAFIYIQTVDIQGKVTTRLLSSKSQVAPLKNLSIPRLELCADM
jgi:hypothetical protein